MKVTTETLEKGKVRLEITVENKQVEEAFNIALEELAEEVEIKGFRKGEAPLTKVEKAIDPGRLNGRVINKLVPDAYQKAIQEKDLKPAANPRIEIKKFARGNEFVFEAVTAEIPEVELGNWKTILKKLGEKPEIETAATITQAESKAEKEPEKPKISPQQVLEALREEIDLEIPEMMVEDEVSRMLTRLYDRLDALGMEPEEYLQNKNLTQEELRKNYEKEARKLIKNEFILSKLGEELEIEVSDKEVKEAIQATQDEKARESLESEANKSYIRAILRKNKIIAKLLKVAEGS